METDYISRKEALEAAWHNYYPSIDHYCVSVKCATRKDLEKIPAADVRPVVRAHWVETAPINEETMKPFIVKGPHLKCSNCGSIEFQRKFCPNCGADMREERK